MSEIKEKEKKEEQNKGEEENNEEDEEEKELIKYSFSYGGITPESVFWDDYEEMGEGNLLKHKIIKVKIYTGTYSEKQVIFGLGCVFKDLFTGEIKEEKVHKGTEPFVDVKEYDIKGEEYLTDFYIRIPIDAEYITQLGFGTNKKNPCLLIGTEEGENRSIELNGGDSIIVGTFGCTNKKLDAMGCLYISKKEYIKRRLFGIFMLRYKIKKDGNFKKTWDEQCNTLPLEFQFLWRTANLSDDKAFSQIIRYCYL